MAGPSIEVGKTYWLNYAGQRFQVQAVRPATYVPGWWFCATGRDEEAMFPEKAFGEEVPDDG